MAKHAGVANAAGARSVRAPFGAGARRSPAPAGSSGGSRLFQHQAKSTLPSRPPGDQNPWPEAKASRLLLLGAPEARPEGLERMLVRAGFAVLDSETAADGAPHVILLGATPNDPSLIERVRDMARNPRHDGASIIVLLTGGTALHTAALLAAGAADVIRAPIDVTEVEARLAADARRRATLASARKALRARETLFEIFQEVSSALKPEDVFQTLVRRVGEAFGLSHCSFVLTGPGGAQGRVVAVFENPNVRDLPVQLDRYPEIQEALRTRAPVVVSDVHQHPLFAAIRRRWEDSGWTSMCGPRRPCRCS